ncbi:methionyl-tRNA formyltransferase [Kangiella koreensis]|uniref:Methionyl-tRNA formyltransferase n=1 Tax=Kangiella koreensis (strain DSM 16069 / JCM 12317 / KCTC 12182 / SW-125) TaxID=523791 RepID=C7RA08_KANKD|nr:methionyl-tRNA formyltransferase [Kangiella koreensis]ACV28027.1 methionyl-tRNA formyltransferase [Kangiella koreensis DSM 16069]
MPNSLKVIFAGTPDFATGSLAAVLKSHHQVVAVYTQPDRKAGRGKKISMSPVKELALEHDIPVEQPINFKSEESLAQLASYEADVMVVVAYGLLLPQSVLDTPRLGCINVHGSLLPRWRGAAPIQRSIQAGDTETGVTIMQMEAGLDTGPMLLTASLPITEQDTGSSLHDKLAEQGAQLLVEALDKLSNNQLSPTPQDDSLATYAHKLSKAEAQLDWQLSAQELERTIRAFNSWPVAYSLIDEATVRIWQANVCQSQTKSEPGVILQADSNGILVACGQDGLLLTELQLPGSRAMSAKDLLNAPKNQQLFALGRQFASL